MGRLLSVPYTILTRVSICNPSCAHRYRQTLSNPQSLCSGSVDARHGPAGCHDKHWTTRRSLITSSLDGAQVAAAPRSRQYPDEPRVGIGVVMLRSGPEKRNGTQETEVLLVRRAKAPEIGKWTVPGGSLELGETMVECAVREAFEETGMHLLNDVDAAHTAEQAVGGLSDTLETPTPFAAADVIVHDDSGRLSFHYAIVEVAALLQYPHAELKPGGDVDAAQWKEVASLPGMRDLTKNSAKICAEAAKRFARALRVANKI